MAGDICELVSGRIDDFRGLPPLSLSRPAACLGEEVRRGVLKAPVGSWEYRVFHARARGAEVWLLSADGQSVDLLEIYGLAGLTRHEVRRLLGPPVVVEFPLAARLQRPILHVHEDAEEALYPARGLAFLFASSKRRAGRLARLRVCAPMTLEDYIRRFVALPAVTFEPP